MTQDGTLQDVLEDAREPLERFLSRRGVPGIIIAAARGSAPTEHLVLGADAEQQPLTADSLLPVASITKLATALAILRLCEASALSLDDPLSRYIPEAAASDEGITIRALLSHSAGMPAWHTFPEDSDVSGSWPALRQAFIRTAPDRAPRACVLYGNVGYGLLGAVIERCTEMPVHDAIRTLVLVPLGIEGYLGIEPPRRVSAVSDVRSPLSDTDRDPLNSAHARALGSPWAGLVTTAEGALVLARAFLPRAGFLRAETAARAVANQVEGLGGGFFGRLVWDLCPWGAGPELRGAKNPHWAPREASPDSFGHVGSTGCLVWVDPHADVAWALLGTRTYFNGWILRCGRGIGQRLLRAHP